MRLIDLLRDTLQCTEVRFASFLSVGFITMAVINPPDWKLANRNSVQYLEVQYEYILLFKLQPSFIIWGAFKELEGALTQKRSFLVVCTT